MSSLVTLPQLQNHAFLLYYTQPHYKLHQEWRTKLRNSKLEMCSTIAAALLSLPHTINCIYLLLFTQTKLPEYIESTSAALLYVLLQFYSMAYASTARAASQKAESRKGLHAVSCHLCYRLIGWGLTQTDFLTLSLNISRWKSVCMSAVSHIS